MLQKIRFIIIHCSATRPSQDIGVKEIDRWHRSQGWACCGYHFVIRKDGTVEQGRAVTQAGAHCSGHNYHSLGICYVGGLDVDGHPADTRTVAQEAALQSLVRMLHRKYPNAKVVGHNDLNPSKACPCFDVVEWFSHIV